MPTSAKVDKDQIREMEQIVVSLEEDNRFVFVIVYTLHVSFPIVFTTAKNGNMNYKNPHGMKIFCCRPVYTCFH